MQDLQMVRYRLICKSLKEKGNANEELNNYENFKEEFSLEEFKEILRKKQNRKNKRYRTKNKFLEMYKIAMCWQRENKKIVFGTITLNNDHLRQKEDTYIRKINEWLKEHFIYSIVNKDFGTKTEREHYHFIGLTNEELEDTNKKSKTGYKIYELVNKTYNMGFEPTLCLIDLNINDFEKTIEYLLKLNNHSNKISTKNRIRIIKNHEARMIILLNNLEPKKKANNSQKNGFKEKLKSELRYT